MPNFTNLRRAAGDHSNTYSILPGLSGQNTVQFPLCLAPMVGLTHVALRRVIREYMPANAQTIWPTEMLNSRRIPGENLQTTPETMRHESETQLVPQILGNEEKAIAKSVERLAEWGAVGIDINMGCPVEKALKHNYGVALMGDFKYAADVVAMTVRNTKLPVSVKLRAVEGKGETASLIDFVKGIEQAGASWVTLHPRTAEQKRRGSADWSQITSLKKQIQIPVIGNGDIQTADDVLQMLEQTDCDMVMAGRALAARPWLLWQVGERLGFAAPEGKENRKAPQTSLQEGVEYGACLLKLIQYSKEHFAPELALRKIRFYIRTTSVWLLFGQELISISTKAKNLVELELGVSRFFNQEIEMVQKTELRQ